MKVLTNVLNGLLIFIGAIAFQGFVSDGVYEFYAIFITLLMIATGLVNIIHINKKPKKKTNKSKGVK